MNVFLLLLAVVLLHGALSVGVAGAVTKLIHHPVPTRQMDKDPVSVKTSRLPISTHSCGPSAPACLEQVWCFKTQTPDPGFTGGPAA